MYQKALNDLHKSGVADTSLSGIHSTGKMIFRKAVEYDLIKRDTNPTEYAKLPKTKKTVEELEQEKELPKFLEKEELHKFLNTAKEKGLPKDHQIFLTLSYSGLRDGELCVLKDTDIVNNDAALSITKTYYNHSKLTDYKLLTPKTKKSIRTVEMDPFVIKELRKLISKQTTEKMKHRKIYHDKGFIFTSDKYPGYPINTQLIGRRMKRLLRLAGLNEELTPHSLRHTHVSLLAEAGVDLEEIMDRMGHQDDSTTRLIYLHVTQNRKKEAVHKFSKLMSNSL